MALRQPEKIFQQFTLPRIPYFWTCAANVGNGEQIKSDKAPFIPHLPGKVRNHIHIGYIFFLRRSRHEQMIFYEPRDQIRVFRRHSMTFAEAPGVHLTEDRMVPLSSFGNVVE